MLLNLVVERLPGFFSPLILALSPQGEQEMKKVFGRMRPKVLIGRPVAAMSELIKTD